MGAGARLRKPMVQKIKGQMAVRWRYIEVLAFKNKVSVGQIARNIVYRSLVTKQFACRFAVTKSPIKSTVRLLGSIESLTLSAIMLGKVRTEHLITLWRAYALMPTAPAYIP